jgi:hypothetical protein
MLLLFFMSKFSSDSSPETFEGQFNFISWTHLVCGFLGSPSARSFNSSNSEKI